METEILKAIEQNNKLLEKNNALKEIQIQMALDEAFTRSYHHESHADYRAQLRTSSYSINEEKLREVQEMP